MLPLPGGFMKLIQNLAELKKGDTVIVKDNTKFYACGFARVFGDVFSVDQENPNFTIRCKETGSIETISIDNGTIFLIS
jgi:hypothetical protein